MSGQIQRTAPNATPAAAQKPVATVTRASLEGAKPFRVITYNTAAGNPNFNHVPQAKLVDLPFYQEIVKGHPNAAILAAQEVGRDQAGRLEELAKNGNFSAVFAWPKPWQGNMILVPKRFEVESAVSHTLSNRILGSTVETLKRWLAGGKLPKPFQLVEPRMYTQLSLRDTQSGKRFTVFNTHVSTEKVVRYQQLSELAKVVHGARAKGPVLLMGDLNTPSKPKPDSIDAKIHELLAGLQDMGPKQGPPKKANIDYVLADGFERVSARYHTGPALKLPKLPNAESISDHIAEDDTVRFA